MVLAVATSVDAQTIVARGKDSSAVIKEDDKEWGTLDGTMAGAPDACRAPNGDVFVVVRGTDDGGWFKRQQNGEWTAWTSLGGRVKSDISALCMPDGTARAFARQFDDTLAIHTTKPLEGWESLGGRLDGTPEVSINAKNVIDVVVRGSDELVWHARFDGKAWAPWRSLGVRTSSDPSIARITEDRAELVVTQGGAAYHGTVPDSGPVTMSKIEGAVSGAVDASSIRDGRMDLVARGPNDSVLHNSYDGKSWSGWKNLGGTAASDPSVAAAPQRQRMAKQ
jgi:hypothetical protein